MNCRNIIWLERISNDAAGELDKALMFPPFVLIIIDGYIAYNNSDGNYPGSLGFCILYERFGQI